MIRKRNSRAVGNILKPCFSYVCCNEQRVTICLKMRTTVWRKSFDTLPEGEVVLRTRAVDLNGLQTNSRVMNDLTHEWDGWLFGLLTLGAVWPAFCAFGWF